MSVGGVAERHRGWRLRSARVVPANLARPAFLGKPRATAGRVPHSRSVHCSDLHHDHDHGSGTTNGTSRPHGVLVCCLSAFYQTKLPPGANRILFVKNLNYQITGEDLYDLFGRYGSIRQIRIGNDQKSRGTAFVVFDDVMDVSSCCSNAAHLRV